MKPYRLTLHNKVSPEESSRIADDVTRGLPSMPMGRDVLPFAPQIVQGNVSLAFLVSHQFLVAHAVPAGPLVGVT